MLTRSEIVIQLQNMKLKLKVRRISCFLIPSHTATTHVDLL